MVSGTQEEDLEQHIEDYLCGHGYQGLAPQGYDRALGLVLAEVLASIGPKPPYRGSTSTRNAFTSGK